MKFLPFAFLLAGVLHAADFHISTSGKDTNSGTVAEPFASLERARAAVREWRKGEPKGAATVFIAGGVYPKETTFELTAEDSGTAGAPVTWRAEKDGAARLDARRHIDPKNFHKVTDASMLARMAGEARGHVVTLDLKKAGIEREATAGYFRGRRRPS